MKILFVIGGAVKLGGHYNSCISLGEELRSCGHRIFVAIREGAIEVLRDMEKAGIEIMHVPEFKDGTILPSIKGSKMLSRYIGDIGIDVVHAYDWTSIARSFDAALRANCAIVNTEAGGEFRGHIPTTAVDTIVFSKEQIDRLERYYKSREDNLHLVRARINTNIYRKREVERDFLDKYKLPMGGVRVVLATRLAEGKRKWLDTIINAAREICRKHLNAAIVVAGDGPLLEEYRRLAEDLNRESLEYNNNAILRFIGPIIGTDNMVSLYNYANIVMGTGRGIMEAMACEKPIVIMGENGEGEIVEEKNIEETAYYNFSGRHFRKRGKNKDMLVDAIIKLAGNERIWEEKAKFTTEYVRTKLDIKYGAQQHMQIYEKALQNKPKRIEYIDWITHIMIDRAMIARKKMGGIIREYCGK